MTRENNFFMNKKEKIIEIIKEIYFDDEKMIQIN